MNAPDIQSLNRRKFLLASAALSLGGCANDDSTTLAASNTDTAIPADTASRQSLVGKAWARTSVNAPIFRKDALTSNATFQYIAYYDDLGEVIVGQRLLTSDDWIVSATGFYGHPEDAHNSISLMIDGDGILHLAWDHHVDPLNYARSVAADTLNFSTPETMIGEDEDKVTYPEFHALPSGDLLFAYRHGSSGNGRLVLNRYSLATRRWTRVQSNLLDGQGQRNAYWQMHIDSSAQVHLSWIWRESSDVMTNHDIHYARSDSDGQTWSTISGTPQTLPITLSNAEPVWPVAEAHNLINQTSLTAAPDGTPYIATYFRAEQGVTNIQLVYFDKTLAKWRSEAVSDRVTDFELGGRGTKSLPISRPIVLWEMRGSQHWIHVIYRDAEWDDHAVHAYSERNTGAISATWQRDAIAAGSLDRWEPSFDSRLWASRGILHLYVQKVGQIDQEGVAEDYPATQVSVLELIPEQCHNGANCLRGSR